MIEFFALGTAIVPTDEGDDRRSSRRSPVLDLNDR